MEKVLSIIIPTYNMEKYLNKCLSSLIIPEVNHLDLLEVLVIIDGATDRSLEIAQGFQYQFPNSIRVINKENGNYGSCINRGLAEAKGRYVKILDADDYIVTENLEKLLLFLKTANVDLVVTDFQTVDEKDDVTGIFRFYAQPSQDLPFSAIDVAGIMQMHMVTYKTENLRKLNYQQTEKVSYTDQEWIFTPMASVETFHYLNEVVYCYLLGREGQTMDAAVYQKSQPQLMTVCLNMAREFETRKVSEQHRAYLAKRLYFNLRKIYKTALLDYAEADLSTLADFDSCLKKESPSAYKIVSSCKLNGKYPYIYVWRLFKYRKTPRLLQKYIQKLFP